MSTGIKLGYVPVPDRATGVAIGKHLVAGKQIACANLLGPMTSMYEWEGVEACSEEFLLLVKTTEALVDATTRLIEAEHPYDCPCVVWIEVAAGSDPFLEWVRGQTQPSGPLPSLDGNHE